MNGRHAKPGFKKDEELIQLESSVSVSGAIQKPAMSTKKKQILKKNVSHRKYLTKLLVFLPTFFFIVHLKNRNIKRQQSSQSSVSSNGNATSSRSRSTRNGAGKDANKRDNMDDLDQQRKKTTSEVIENWLFTNSCLILIDDFLSKLKLNLKRVFRGFHNLIVY